MGHAINSCLEAKRDLVRIMVILYLVKTAFITAGHPSIPITAAEEQNGGIVMVSNDGQLFLRKCAMIKTRY